jgi:hypothetical protein
MCWTSDYTTPFLANIMVDATVDIVLVNHYRWLSSAKGYCQEKIDTLNSRNDLPSEDTSTTNATGCPFHGSAPKSTYLSDVIESGKLTLPEVFTNFSEIMFAAADTVCTACHC